MKKMPEHAPIGEKPFCVFMPRNDLVGFDSISTDDFFRTAKAIGYLWLKGTSGEESGNIKLNTLLIRSVFYFVIIYLIVNGKIGVLNEAEGYLEDIKNSFDSLLSLFQ